MEGVDERNIKKILRENNKELKFWNRLK
jgi:hypothetical protein